MNTCRTSVPNGTGGYRACGEPATEAVQVGLRVCDYCAKHADEARRFAARQTQIRIANWQRYMR